MATFNYSGYDDDQVIWPGDSPSNGDTITFSIPTVHVISITDNDSQLVDGTDDRDDEDSSQTAIVYDEFGDVETSGQVQPRDEITLTDGTNTYYMTEVFIAASNSYYYIFQDPAPELGVSYTVTNVGSPNSTNYSELSSPGITCYAPGTLIDTPDGPRAIETLRPGDLVLTVDHGPQPIRWVRQNDHPLAGADVEDKPVLIQAGALGAGRPLTDLIVSPQHRILVGAGGQLTQYFRAAAFAPAKALTRLGGIRHMKGKTKITWIHFACDRHEVVTANSCLSESLLPGPMVLNGLTLEERRTLMNIFKCIAKGNEALNIPAARPCLKVSQVRRQIANGAASKRAAVASEIRKWDVDAAMERYESEHLRSLHNERAEASA